jgi:kexin
MSNRVAVKVRDGADASAVAERHGGTLRFKIEGLPGWCEFSFKDVAAAEAAAAALKADADVEDAVHQPWRHGQKKTNDPFFNQQWHLQGVRAADKHLDLGPAWTAGYTGTGVSISIVDDGTQTAHPDLAGGYSAALSYDYIDNDTNPNPAIPGDTHGTATAGLAIARADNGIGVAGVAYNATWGAVRLLDSNQTDTMEAAAVTHALANVDIYSNSWGAPDNGDYYEAGPLFRAAIQNGVATGRGGLGAIYVWAAGNGYGPSSWWDDSNLDGYAAMPETIAIASINRVGSDSTYSEPGANIVTTAPGGEDDVLTTDRTGADGYNDGTVFPNADYTNDFSGTSAATPMVSGIVALMLQANPQLTWRDVQHILVYASDPTKVGNTGKATNGVGYTVSVRWGFGMLQASRAVELAASWANVPAQVMQNSPTDNANVAIPDAAATGVTRQITMPTNLIIEHVVVEFTASHTAWGDLRITLTSPSGTVSKLVTPENRASPSGNTWKFLSVRHWGEDAQGQWTLKVADEILQDVGTLQSWRLTFMGTNTRTDQGGTIGNTTPIPTVQYLPFNHTFTFTGGTNVQWKLVGAAPPGLSIDSTGKLSGTPTMDGTFNFTVEAQSLAPPAFDSASVSMTVTAGTPPTSTPKKRGGGGGGGCAAGSSGIAALLGVPILAAYIRRRRRVTLHR